jgi:2',3'-cyclic-nucleotide 2'-phosphodiesterase (5'-nucleotidase family)
VHCGIDGYTKLAGLRDAINQSDTAWAAVVCSGDFLQGGTSGAISRGQYIVDIMRNVGYKAITLGNHEFDYGVPRLKNLLSGVNAPVVCANFYDVGAEKSYFPAYVIQSFGDKRVAFIGAVTPETMILEEYAFYDNHDNLSYTLKPDDFYALIQQAVDNARQEGADYVVLLSHVGESTQSMGFDSHRLVQATKGIDVVLDGHSHSVIPHDKVSSLDGKTIEVTQTGTQFANIGKLLITRNGQLSTELVPTKDLNVSNARVSATTDSIMALLKVIESRKVADCAAPLRIYDDNGTRLVRNEETNSGDFVTDAYRYVMDAEIGLSNGGGIRNERLSSELTYGDLINMLPFENYVWKVEATGAKIIELLQKSTSSVPKEDGDFPQVSGVKFTLHTSDHSISDGNGNDFARTFNRLPFTDIVSRAE